MPGRLTLSQGLTGIDGRPSASAYVALVLLMAVAATTGYAAASEGEGGAEPKRAVAIERLAGDLPIARPVQRPRLRSASAVPALAAGRRRPGGRNAARPALAPTPKPQPARPATEPTSSPEPTAPVSHPAPAPAPRAPARTPAPTFDLSG